MSERQPVTVTPQSGRRDAKAFLEFPYRLYRDHPVWIPPLRIAERDMFDQKKNPFFEHASVQHFLARRGSRVVGRIAAIQNDLHNETFADRMGFFGFFDAEPDPEATKALVDAARALDSRAWSDPHPRPRELQHQRHVRRPDRRLRSPPHRDDAVQPRGLRRTPPRGRPGEGKGPPRLLDHRRERAAGAVRTSRGAPPSRSPTSSYVPSTSTISTARSSRLSDVYNRCWADNWGFVPATGAEFKHAAKQMKMLLEPHCSAVAELNGDAGGALPRHPRPQQRAQGNERPASSRRGSSGCSSA